ncbi:MAG: tetratricopeptide repeat protein [Bernardetiaceae bacterium]|nr:tetratricopeptide repeat protein [Bernardetiaceae bacterium]
MQFNIGRFILIISILMLVSCQASIKKQLDEARNLLAEENYEAALAVLNEAIKKNKREPDAYNMRGVVFFEQGDFAQAKDDFARAVKLNDKNYKYLYNLANAKRASGDLKGALADYDIALERNPDISEVYLNRGITLFELNRDKEAVLDLNQSINLNAADKNAYYARGEVFFRMKELEKAATDLEKCVRLDERFGKGYHLLALIELAKNKGKKNTAICEHLNAALRYGFREAQTTLKTYCN